MIKFEYNNPTQTDIFGTLKVSVIESDISYKFPLTFIFYRKVDNREIWRCSLEYYGWWASYSETCNGYAKIYDADNNIVDSWDWDTIQHGDDIHRYFYNWCRNNKGSKGIAIGTHDGTTGEWVVPVEEGLIDAILIEATSQQYQSLYKNYKDFKNVKTINTLVSPNGGLVDFYEVKFSYVNSVFKSHVQKFTSDENEVQKISKESLSLNDLIIQSGLKDDLSWLHLDVEGLDGDLIMSLDDTIIKMPDIIIYESVNFSVEEKNKITDWLKSKSYFVKEIHWNTYALKMSDSLSLLVHTNDNYERFWAGMSYCLDFYWDFDNFPVYFANEEKKIEDIVFDCKGLYCSMDKRIKQIMTGKTVLNDGEPIKNGFSDRLIKAVEQVPSKYLIYIQEDHWLRRGLEKGLLDDLVKFMEENNANSIKIHAKLHFYDYAFEKTEHFIKGQRLLKQDLKSLMSHNATIWRKDYLLKYQAYKEDPWKNEDNGTIRMKDDAENSYHYNIHWYCQPGCSDSGEYSQEFFVYAHVIDEMKNTELKYQLK